MNILMNILNMITEIKTMMKSRGLIDDAPNDMKGSREK